MIIFPLFQQLNFSFLKSFHFIQTEDKMQPGPCSSRESATQLFSLLCLSFSAISTSFCKSLLDDLAHRRGTSFYQISHPANKLRQNRRLPPCCPEEKQKVIINTSKIKSSITLNSYTTRPNCR